MKKHLGFTLIELIITIVLGAIVLTMGIPSFQEMVRQNRLATQVNVFVSALSLARSEAVKRGVRVSLCKSADQASCTNSGAYDQGWIVFVDADEEGDVDDADADIIRVFEGAPAGMTISGNANVADYISFTADGASKLLSNAFQAGTIDLCNSPDARQIIINSIGRARINQTSC